MLLREMQRGLLKGQASSVSSCECLHFEMSFKVVLLRIFRKYLFYGRVYGVLVLQSLHAMCSTSSVTGSVLGNIP